MANNFLNLQFNQNVFAEQDGLAEPLQTIEFRQHRGTLDPELITHWVTVVCSLVENSYRDEGDFCKLFDELHANDSMYTVFNLFEDLQIRKQAELYAPLVHQNGADRNPAAWDNSIMGENPPLTDTLFPRQYDTPWEKKFAPRPPCELTSFQQNPYAETHSNRTESQVDENNANRDSQLLRTWKTGRRFLQRVQTQNIARSFGNMFSTCNYHET